MYRRGDIRSQTEILNEILRRLERLEESSSRKILPAGYVFTTNDAGELVVVRESDGATSSGIV